MADEVIQAAAEALRRSVPAAYLRSEQGLDRVLAVLREEFGEIDLSQTLARVLTALDAGSDGDELGAPLPRLHVPQHLYAPLLLKAPARVADEAGQLSLLDDAPAPLTISPPPLEQSEARLVWDLRRQWQRLHALPEWAGVEVALLRNLSGVGVRLFAAEGFFPDFLLWIKRGPRQALAFVEPKGLRHQWPQDKFELLEQVVPQWNFSVPVRGFVLASNSEDELRRLRPDFRWSADNGCLIHQDERGDYVAHLLGALLGLLG